MDHSKVSRAKAVKALRETNDDMLEAILKLTN
jgi:NACalpha-BTF3-like transcription factor